MAPLMARPRTKDPKLAAYRKEVGERIARARGNFKPEYVAARLGVTDDTYRKWESGRSLFPMHRLLDFCILTRSAVSPIVTGMDDGAWFGDGTGTFRKPRLIKAR